MKKRSVLFLVILFVTLVGYAQSEYTNCYQLTPIGLNKVCLGAKVANLPETFPQVYKSRASILDGLTYDGEFFPAPDNAYLPTAMIRSVKYREWKGKNLVGTLDTKDTSLVIHWEKAPSAKDANEILGFKEPPSIEYYTGKPFSVFSQNGEIVAIYVYSPRFKTMEHGLCATSSLWDIYEAGGEVVFTRDGDLWLEADGVRFFALTTLDEKGKPVVDIKNMSENEKQQMFGNKKEFRMSIKNNPEWEAATADEKEEMKLSLMGQRTLYILIDKWHRPKGFDIDIKKYRAEPLAVAAPKPGTVTQISKRFVPNGASKIANREALELIATKTSIGPIKMGDNYKGAVEILKKYFYRVTCEYLDMTECYCINCYNSDDFGSLALSIQTESESSNKKVDVEKIKSYFFTPQAKFIKTQKGYRSTITYGEVMQAGGKWVKTQYEKYVLLDGLSFFFPDNPTQNDTALQINNAEYHIDNL